MKHDFPLCGHRHTLTQVASTFLLLAGLPMAFVQAADWEGAHVEQELLDTSMRPSNWAVSIAASATRNGCRVAKVEGNTLDGFTVRVDGKPGTRYSEIAAATPVFSDDGSAVAYCARSGISWRWIVNGVEGPEFPEMTATSFAFSTDGKRHAYVVIPSFRHTALVVDGVAGPSIGRDKPMPWDAAPVFSPNGTRLAYVEALHERQQMRVNLDGKPGPWHRNVAMATSPGFGARGAADTSSPVAGAQQRPTIFSMNFSVDSKHFSYAAGDLGGGWCKVIDGVRTQAYEGTGVDFVFSIDGSDHAYMARKGGSNFIVRGKGERLPVKEISDRTLTFSPDGKHLAFAGVCGETRAIWLDGKAAPCDVSISRAGYGTIYFSPDSKRIAFIVESPEPKLHWVVDGKAGPGTTIGLGQKFDFSPDSAHFAYAFFRSESKDVAIVVDGKVRAAYATVPSGPVFRHDGTLEFLAVTDDGLARFKVTGY